MQDIVASVYCSDNNHNILPFFVHRIGGEKSKVKLMKDEYLILLHYDDFVLGYLVIKLTVDCTLDNLIDGDYYKRVDILALENLQNHHKNLFAYQYLKFRDDDLDIEKILWDNTIDFLRVLKGNDNYHFVLTSKYNCYLETHKVNINVNTIIKIQEYFDNSGLVYVFN